MTALHLSKLSSTDHLVNPMETTTLSPQSPAVQILNDFKQYKPPVIEWRTRAIDAQRHLRFSHMFYCIVVDDQNECIGIIDQCLLSGEKIIQEVSKGIHREDILVSDLMIKREAIFAFSFSELGKSQVFDVLETLNRQGLEYSLVVDEFNHEIRGILSAKEIAEQLEIELESKSRPSFAEIFSVIHP